MAKINSSVLILTADVEWAKTALSHLHPNFEGGICHTGKEGQLALYRQEYSYVFIDLSITNNSAIEVIRFIHQKYSSIKIFAFSDENSWNAGGWDEQKLTKMGVTQIFVGLKPADINTPIKSMGLIKKWENVEEVDGIQKDDSEKSIEDTKFTRIKIDDLFNDAVAIFDFYIRIGANKYVKIIHKGEKASVEQIRKYSMNGAKFLYFLAEERADFIGYQNELISQKIKDNGDSNLILKNMRSVSDKYLEEIYTNGLQPFLIDEGKAVCENIFQFTQKDKNLSKMLSELEEFNPVAYSHSFLVCFFSTIISKNLEWISSRTRDALAMGAMFHDIGLIHVPENLAHKQTAEMTEEEKVIFQKHPEKGRDSLTSIPSITRSIMEIIMQHHEVSDGTGYPFGLSGSKIFPMAKVVGLADAYSNFIVEKEVSPRDGLKEFLNCRENLTKYEPDLIKNLIKGFIPEKKT